MMGAIIRKTGLNIQKNPESSLRRGCLAREDVPGKRAGQAKRLALLFYLWERGWQVRV
jgi:hypothetical protein